MQELQIRSKGFPQLVADLGVQSPLQGPFWTISTLAMPVYLVGSSEPTSVGPQEYSLNDVTSAQVANPLGSSIIAQTAALDRGKYAIRIDYWFNNQTAATFSELLLTTSDPTLGTTQLVSLDLIGFPTIGHNVVQNTMEMGLEMPHDGGFFIVQNLTALTTALVNCVLRWRRTGPLLNF